MEINVLKTLDATCSACRSNCGELKRPHAGRARRNHLLWLAVVATSVASVACSRPVPPMGTMAQGGDYNDLPSMIKFQDAPQPQEAPAIDFAALPLTTPDGKAISLQELAAGRNLVVVFSRGYGGSICPYCSTQTARLIAGYPEISKRNAEVVVIYPLNADSDVPRVGDFLKRVNEFNGTPTNQAAPFPVLIDVGLKAVDVLGIRKDLAKPATYILDPTGAVRFAYVGNSLADRPSVKALLQQLDALAPPAAGG